MELIDKYCAYMDELGYSYNKFQDNAVLVGGRSEKIGLVPVYVTFEKDLELVIFNRISTDSYDESFASALVICNKMNSKFLGVKFYLDDSKNLIIDNSIKIDSDNVGEECMVQVFEIVRAVEEFSETFDAMQ